MSSQFVCQKGWTFCSITQRPIFKFVITKCSLLHVDLAKKLFYIFEIFLSTLLLEYFTTVKCFDNGFSEWRKDFPLIFYSFLVVLKFAALQQYLLTKYVYVFISLAASTSTIAVCHRSGYSITFLYLFAETLLESQAFCLTNVVCSDWNIRCFNTGLKIGQNKSQTIFFISKKHEK